MQKKNVSSLKSRKKQQIIHVQLLYSDYLLLKYASSFIPSESK